MSKCTQVASGHMLCSDTFSGGGGINELTNSSVEREGYVIEIDF